MPKENLEEMSLVPARVTQKLSTRTPNETKSGDDTQKTAQIVAATVAATLQQLGPQLGYNPAAANEEAKRIAELALTVLDGCSVNRDGNLIELHDGGIVSDMMTVRAYKELEKAAGRLGVDKDEVSARVAEAFAEHMEAATAQARERGVRLGPQGDPMMGPEDSDRKGIFGGK